jgi:hypothetical protein
MPKYYLALLALILTAPMAQAAGGGVPTLNVKPTCQGVSLGTLSEKVDPKADTERCLKSENDARATLVKVWNEFPASDRDRCTRTAQMGGSNSYVQLLTCLEMEREARKLPKDLLDSSGPSVTQPTRLGN